MREWAIAGAGIVYKSRLDLEHDIQAMRLTPLLQNYRGEYSPINAVYLSSKFLPLKVKALLDFLVAKFETV